MTPSRANNDHDSTLHTQPHETCSLAPGSLSFSRERLYIGLSNVIHLDQLTLIFRKLAQTVIEMS